MNYLIAILGWLIGMLLLMVFSSIRVQVGRKYEVSFWMAMRIYLTKDTGPLILSLVMLVAGVFILPQMIVTHALVSSGTIPLDGFKTKAVNAIINDLRIYSILFGIGSQGLGFALISNAPKILSRITGFKESDMVAPGPPPPDKP